MLAICITHGREFQSQSAARIHMPYNGVGSYLSFLHKKIDFGRQT